VEIAINALLTIVGLAMLCFGGNWLVSGGVSIAKKLRISQMVIGLTVVAYGTSTPEMAASVAAAVGAHTDLILGNVVGSNISNIGMVIGISAIISPLVVSKATTRKEVDNIVTNPPFSLSQKFVEHAFLNATKKVVILNKLSKPSVGIDSKNIINSHTLVWTAGVTPVEIIQNSIFKIKKGKIIVNEFLEIPNYPGIFAIGDCSQFDDEVNNKFPPTAQLAEAHAKLVAYNIKQTIENKEKKKFEYSWKGQSAIIGKHYGIAEVMGMKITGFWAWILWRNYYLTKMPNLEKRIRVWLDWNIDLFSRIDISRYGFKRDTSKEYRELDEVDDVW